MARRLGHGATASTRGALLLLATILGGCAAGEAPESQAAPRDREASVPAPPSPLVAERDGLKLEAELRATTTELIAEVVVRNERTEPVHLVPDQCGRVTEVFLVRTALQPEGRRWGGSLQAVKDLILRDQLSRQGPDRFHPPRPPADADPGSFCQRPEAPIALAPGEEHAERWNLPRSFASALDEVGSEGSAVRIEVVEARSADEIEFLNVLSWVDADGERAGRNLRIEHPASELIRTLPSESTGRLSLGELFDEIVTSSAELWAWIESQPADGWRDVELVPAAPEFGAAFADHRLRLVTSEFERAATVLAAPDLSAVTVDLPGPGDRTRHFVRRSASLPPGIAVIPEPDAYVLTEDLLLPDLILPSGGLVVGEYLLDSDGLDVETSLQPGRYPVFGTLGRYGEDDIRVAFATLVASLQPTVRWEELGVIAVDGGTTTFISTEGRDALLELFDTDPAAWERFWLERVYDSQIAHDHLATEMTVQGEVNLAYFSSGIGDGGYPVYIGYDAADRPTRIVVDFVLVHLDWPVAGE